MDKNQDDLIKVLQEKNGKNKFQDDKIGMFLYYLPGSLAIYITIIALVLILKIVNVDPISTFVSDIFLQHNVLTILGFTLKIRAISIAVAGLHITRTLIFYVITVMIGLHLFSNYLTILQKAQIILKSTKQEKVLESIITSHKRIQGVYSWICGHF